MWSVVLAPGPAEKLFSFMSNNVPLAPTYFSPLKRERGIVVFGRFEKWTLWFVEKTFWCKLFRKFLAQLG